MAGATLKYQLHRGRWGLRVPRVRMSISIFISYSHRDDNLRGALATHLTSLQRERLIEAWHDTQIGAGEDWDGEIDAHLNTAQVILLLLSPDFLASKYCYERESMRALERQQAGEAVVIPI